MHAHKSHLFSSNPFKGGIPILGPGTILIIVLILAWEFTVHLFQIWSSAFPAPSRVLLEIWRNAGQLERHAGATAAESVAGLLIAIIVASPLSAVAVRYPGVRHVLRPVRLTFQKIPLLGLAPLMVIWFGFGLPPAIAVSALLCFLPFCRRFHAGLKSVPIEVEELLRIMGASPYATLVKVYLPASLPYAAAAIKTAIPLALTGATVTEFIGSDTGLGFMMMNAGAKADSTLLFAALTILVLMALIAQGLVALLERTWITWPASPPYRFADEEHAVHAEPSYKRGE